MKRFYFLLILVFFFTGCKKDSEENKVETAANDTIAATGERDYKVLDSKYIVKDSLWAPLEEEMASLSNSKYDMLRPLILDKTIPELQTSIKT
ncbi:hypothetical protein [Antarcticibacterium sp. 1MA-6-2]|uniref:hypothetical protein n=1 Tax=Antarcticibacterium sp. 1MA-6-2 TaxID=2908210 RepID=UPI002883503F|nr:hypothetical protein [Antarcticibacterium sp. 1MA-6-2]